MNRAAVLATAAFGALVAAAIGLAVCVIPTIAVWMVRFGMSGPAATPWRAGGDIWLLGHGVDLRIAVSTHRMTALGLPASAGSFEMTIAVTGLALLTALLAARIGYRADAAGHPWAAAAAGAAVFLAVGALVAASTRTPAVAAAFWQGILLPPAVFVVGLSVGVAFHRAHPARRGSRRPTRRSGAPLLRRSMPRWITPDRRELLHDAAVAGTRGAAGALLVFTVLAAALLAAAVFGHYAQIVGLYESVHAGIWGGIVLTAGQLLLIPNAVAWTMAWLAGPGFAIGAGSAYTPLVAQPQAAPALPLLGAVPQQATALGLLALLVPFAAGVAAALLVRPRVQKSAAGREPLWLGCLAALIGLLSGLGVGLLVWWSSGGVGPGRLTRFGADPVAVGACVAVEIALGAAVGLLATRQPARLPDGLRRLVHR